MACNLCVESNGELYIRGICDDCWSKFSNWVMENDNIDTDSLCSCR